jgi:WD40 repeat protein
MSIEEKQDCLQPWNRAHPMYKIGHKSIASIVWLAATVGLAQPPQLNEVSASDKRHRRTQLTSSVAETLASSSSLEIKIPPLPGAKSPPVVTAITASLDGNYLAMAGDDHVIRLYDISLQTVVRELVGHTDWIQSLVFSASGQELYSSGNDGRVLRWLHRYPVEPEEIVKLPSAVRSMSISSYKHLLAIGGFSETIGIWDLANKKWKHEFQCECGDHLCVRFSPDGERLLSGGRDGCLSVWEVESGKMLLHKELHRSRVTEAAFSLDGQTVTSIGEDRRVIQYDLVANAIRSEKELAPARLKSMCLINDDLAAIAGSDNSIRLYDMEVDEVVAKLDGHFGTVAIMCPCGNKLASGSFDTTVRIWDLKEEVARQQLQSMPVGLAPLDVDAKMRIR